MIEFTVDYPGNYVLVDHALTRIDRGAWGVLKVTGSKDKISSVTFFIQFLNIGFVKNTTI